MTTKLDPRRVEYLPLSALVSDPRNPKAHDQQTINDSIGRFGMLDPIVQDQRTGYIISGHGRHTALTQMESKGENQPEGIKVAEDGSWLVPVVTGWASRTDSEAHAALIALNRTTELGGWVDEELLSLLDELSEFEEGFVGIGFTEADREALAHLTQDQDDYGNPEPRDLDKLLDSVGEPTEHDGYARVVIQLPPDLADMLEERLGREIDERVSSVKEWLMP